MGQGRGSRFGLGSRAGTTLPTAPAASGAERLQGGPRPKTRGNTSSDEHLAVVTSSLDDHPCTVPTAHDIHPGGRKVHVGVRPPFARELSRDQPVLRGRVLSGHGRYALDPTRQGTGHLDKPLAAREPPARPPLGCRHDTGVSVTLAGATLRWSPPGWGPTEANPGCRVPANFRPGTPPAAPAELGPGPEPWLVPALGRRRDGLQRR